MTGCAEMSSRIGVVFTNTMFYQRSTRIKIRPKLEKVGHVTLKFFITLSFLLYVSYSFSFSSYLISHLPSLSSPFEIHRVEALLLATSSTQVSNILTQGDLFRERRELGGKSVGSPLVSCVLKKGDI